MWLLSIICLLATFAWLWWAMTTGYGDHRKGRRERLRTR